MKQNKLPTILAITIGVFLLISFLIYFDYKKVLDQPASDSEDLINFTIEEGQAIKDIAENLDLAGLIKNSLYFQFYIRQQGIASQLQAGSYQIPANITMREIAEVLLIAYEQDVWVTIPEGLMALEIADILEQEFSEVNEPAFSKDEFLKLVETSDPVENTGLPVPDGKPCEGYLFPDTYRFSPDSTAQLVITTLIDTFKTKIYNQYQKAITNSGYSLYDILILSSIVEREARHSDDRPMVADILLRRLEANWALEVDATLLYHFKDWEHDITTDDLKIDSVYNTRKYEGLTPTPICNPGEESISAVLNPKSNDYWFYISDKEGNIHYGKTIQEHNQNIDQYLD